MNSMGTYKLFLRRRGVWEAADSGLILWRDSFVFFLPFFAVPVWIAACGLRLLPEDFYPLSYIILWWLKPFFDRLVLHVVSLRFFGDDGSSKIRELRRGLFGSIRRGLLGDLLWRRFSPNRAACMPIRVLEFPDRRQFGLRKKTLSAGGLGFCSFISGLGLGMEVMLLLGEALFAIVITQMFFPTAFSYMQYNMESMEIIIFAAFCFNYILVESLYVCMGFGLYINSRVEVEGWDLQLLFQKFADADSSKMNAKASGINVKTIIVVCLFMTQLFGPVSNNAYAGDAAENIQEYFPEGFPLASASSLDDLNEILDSKDFGYTKDSWEIRFKNNTDDDWEMPQLELAPWVEKLRLVFSVILRFLVIAFIAGFLIYAIFWFWKFHPNLFRRNLFNRKQKSRNGGEAYVNPLLSDESPESLFACSESFYKGGFLREAWAACLAGYIGAYSRYHFISFPVDSTEYGCLDLVREALPGEDLAFGELVQNWIRFVYGGIAPNEGAFEQALSHGRTIECRGAGDET